MKQRDPNNHLMIALRKSGAAGYHKSKKTDQQRKQKHKKKNLMLDNYTIV